MRPFISVIFIVIAVSSWNAFGAQAPVPTAEVSPGALLRADQFDKLEAHYGSYLKNYDPKKTNAYIPLGHALAKLSYTAELLPHANKWIAAKPDSAIAYLIRGSFYVERAYAVHGFNLTAPVGSEAMQVFEDSLDKADADLNRAAKINPSLPFAYARMISIDLLEDRGLEAAAAHFIAARKADPSYLPAYAVYLSLLSPRRGGSASMMKAFVEGSVNKIPGSNLPLLWAMYHVEMAAPGNEGPSWWKDPGHWKQVEENFRNVIDQHPDPVPDRCMFAFYGLSAGKADFVREQLEFVGPYWGRNIPEHLQGGIFDCLSLALPKADPGQWLIERASAELKKNPRAARPLMLRGMAFCRAQQYADAIADLTRAIELDPDLVHAWMDLAISYDATKQYAKAREAADHYLMVHPDAEQIIRIKGDAIRHAGKLDDAIRFFREKINDFPSLAGVYDALAKALREKHDLPALIETCNAGLPWAKRQHNEPILFDLFWMRGLAYQQQRNTMQSFDSFAEALRHDAGEQALDKFAELYRAGGPWAPFRDRIPAIAAENYRAGGDEAKRNSALERFNAKLKDAIHK